MLQESSGGPTHQAGQDAPIGSRTLDPSWSPGGSAVACYRRKAVLLQSAEIFQQKCPATLFAALPWTAPTYTEMPAVCPVFRRDFYDISPWPGWTPQVLHVPITVQILGLLPVCLPAHKFLGISLTLGPPVSCLGHTARHTEGALPCNEGGCLSHLFLFFLI